MTLYFETPLNFGALSTITTNGKWHNSSPFFAVANFNQDKGGFVSILDELGEPIDNVNCPNHTVMQVTALAWHPELTILVTGWEHGELKVWNGTDPDFSDVRGPQKAAIVLLEFSEKGGHLVSCDSVGSIVGWKVSNKGKLITTFHHQLKESITLITYRKTIRSYPDYDLEGLAKAAVNGDEKALDMFSNWRPKTTARKFRTQDGYDNPCFFVGTQSGSLYYVNETEKCIEVLDTEGVPLTCVLHHHAKNALVIMMEGLTIGYFAIDSQGQLTEVSKVKLSGRGQLPRGGVEQGLSWAGLNLIAVLTGDLTVRIWDIETNDNYLLPTNFKQYQVESKPQPLQETLTCIVYYRLNQTLCAGSNIGRIYFWKRTCARSDIFEAPDDMWELQHVNTISGTIKHMGWGSINMRTPLLSINAVTSVYIMREQSLATAVSPKIWATQKTTSKIVVETSNGSATIENKVQMNNLSLNEQMIVLSNGRALYVYEIIITDRPSTNRSAMAKETVETELRAHFPCLNEDVIVHGQNIVVLSPNEVTIKASNGANLAQIATNSTEGEAIGIAVTGNYLTVFTMEGYVKLYDLAHVDQLVPAVIKNVMDVCEDFGEIIQAKSNSAGNMVALTVAASNLIPDRKLYIWDVDKDMAFHYEFANVRINDFYDEIEREEEGEVEKEETNESTALNNRICANKIPLCLFWDVEDPRLLVCDAKRYRTNSDAKKSYTSLYGKNQAKPAGGDRKLEDEDHILITMFVSAEHQIQMQDIKRMDVADKLLGVAVPHILLLHKSDIVREIMSDFIGLEECDRVTKDAVLNFSFNLSLGNMDAAFKAIKLVQTSGVWQSLAKMCVKTRRLDVAGVCLGHMGNATAARALRTAMADATLPQEAKVAILAIQLGMLDEAEQLYTQCERYDLLNKLYQRRNKMAEALHIAETRDRINLKHTEHVIGRIREQEGKISEAIGHYERAGTHRQEVPRMLIDDLPRLQAYMAKTTDPELLRWWGQHMEAKGDVNGALRVYALAGDVYNQVRALCFMKEETRAAELTQSSNDKAAFYHMARYYESNDKFEEAVKFFSKANAYSNAIRLCKERHMIEELWNIGLIAGEREKLECATYLESNEVYGKSVILYHRAGMLHKAIDLAFKTEQFDILQQIATCLDADSDPALIDKCVEYFINNEQFDKAVGLLAIAKKYKEATTLCLNQNVQLTEELVEKLTPEKDSVDEATKIGILENLAESLMLQGHYHLATKKFTQAGDRVRAMKALLKSGDTDKIIFFAGVSRQKEIYIMAANYLQTLDWQNEPEILRNIVTFYSKGKAQESLANFYVACAQIEIDEFQNYEKAYGALTESARCLGKITAPKDVAQHKRATELVQRRLTTIKKFIDIRRLFERGDADAGISQCRQFLASGGRELEESVRRGDVYAVMIQSYVKNEKYLEAKQLFGELKQVLSAGNIPITYYLSKELMEALAKGLGVAASTFLPVISKNTTQENQEEIAEEVHES